MGIRRRLRAYLPPLLNVVTALSLAACVCAYAAPRDQWPQWQGDAFHSGFVPSTLLLDQRTFSWSERPQWPNAVGLAATADAVFTVGPVPVGYPLVYYSLVAQSILDGHALWHRDFPANALLSPPAIADGKVWIVENIVDSFANQATVTLDSIDASSGALLTQESITAHYASTRAPTVFGGHVYVVAVQTPFQTGALWSVDAGTGQTQWQTASVAGGPPAPCGANICTLDTALNVLDVATGTVLHSIGNPGGVENANGDAPMVVGTHAFATLAQTLVDFDLSANAVAWSAASGATAHVGSDGAELFLLDYGALSVRDARTGSLHYGWEAPVYNPIRYDITDNFVITKSHVILSDTFATYVIDRSTHRLVLTFSVGGLLAYAADRLLIEDTNGNITAILLPSDQLFANDFE